MYSNPPPEFVDIIHYTSLVFPNWFPRSQGDSEERAMKTE